MLEFLSKLEAFNCHFSLYEFFGKISIEITISLKHINLNNSTIFVHIFHGPQLLELSLSTNLAQCTKASFHQVQRRDSHAHESPAGRENERQKVNCQNDDVYLYLTLSFSIFRFPSLCNVSNCLLFIHLHRRHFLKKHVPALWILVY